MSVEKKAKLILPDNKELELPIYEATLGKPVIDIQSLKSHYSFDPGFTATAACESKITYIDGEKGELLYRGYPIDELAFDTNFIEVCYLLFYGELPSSAQYQHFSDQVKHHSDIHQQISSFFHGFRRDAHPMAMMAGVIGSLSAFYSDGLDIHKEEDRQLSAIRLVAKIPALAAMCYKYSIGQPFIHPQKDLEYTDNFLHMMFSTPYEKSTAINPILSRAMDRIFTLHADHEQNASTTTVRAAGSTGANPFVCIASGVSALWGPAHGGANEAALNMLQMIGSEKNIAKYIAKAKDKDDPFRLMGFGHRVYKNFDPRAKVMQKTCHEVLDEVGKHDDPLFKLAMKLEKIALEDDYFVEKKLYPNIDFYSGITLSALNIPTSMFTVIFALARTSGWISHWMEMMSDPKRKLARPRQLYLGKTRRDVKKIQDRDEP